MKVYSITKQIGAPPERIWAILVAGPDYTQWDPNIERLEGHIALGEKIKVFTKLSPGRAFPATVSRFEPPHIMIWTGGMPLGLFKGERTFELKFNPDGTTHFLMREVFSGLLLPLIGRTIPDLTDPFAQFAAGLKKRAESAA